MSEASSLLKQIQKTDFNEGGKKNLKPFRPSQNKTMQNRTKPIPTKFSRTSFDNYISLGKIWVQDTWSTDLTSMEDWLQILWEAFVKIKLYNMKFLCTLKRCSVFSQNLWSQVKINSAEIMSGSLIMTVPNSSVILKNQTPTIVTTQGMN